MPRAIDESCHLDQITELESFLGPHRLGPNPHRYAVVAVLEVERAARKCVDDRPERLDPMAAPEGGPVAADRLERYGRLGEGHAL